MYAVPADDEYAVLMSLVSTPSTRGIKSIEIPAAPAECKSKSNGLTQLYGVAQLYVVTRLYGPTRLYGTTQLYGATQLYGVAQL